MNEKNCPNPEAKVITIDLWKGVAIIFTAILASAGAGVWGTLRVANTIPFRVEAVEKEIKEHKENSIDSFTKIDFNISEISKSLNNINSRLSRIEGKLE